jgi:8-oxo-dGTP pyrophosphatase MutT (NUDIX family)
MRQLQPSVTIFLHHQGKYLIIHRWNNGKVDSGRLNGVGGKVEPGENYLQAVIRETQEETGYEIQTKDISFCGLARTRDGYAVDWLVAFFRVEVPNKKIPIGDQCREGKFLWLKPEEVFTQGIELVDDLHYLLEKVDENKEIFFAHIQLDEQEKVKEIKIDSLPR